MAQSMKIRANEQAAAEKIAGAFSPETIDALVKDAKATGTPIVTGQVPA
ncbi:hypothetical protein [Frankia sp. AiPa1]|nr:hypothetical protein [Frankia sp. AiPa1]MCL9761012.1 hypothetical protein [Frankia sp. AiPa1]